MIEPLSMLYGGQSFEHEVAEWAGDVTILGYAEDWDGSDRPGLPAAIAENLPSNETNAIIHVWDMPWSWAEAMAKAANKPTMYWFIGPSSYRRGAISGMANKGRN